MNRSALKFFIETFFGTPRIFNVFGPAPQAGVSIGFHSLCVILNISQEHILPMQLNSQLNDRSVVFRWCL